MANTTRLCEDLVCDQQSVRSWFSRLDEGLRLIKNVTNRDKVSHLISNIGLIMTDRRSRINNWNCSTATR